MTPEFRKAERFEPAPTWEEWRKEARQIFLDSFHRQPGISQQAHRMSVFREWDDQEFQIDFENGMTPAAACKHYFDRRNTDDDQNEPL